MLSYFGCDQSQVQRYLTAKSIDEARQSLLMSAFLKIPLQLLILRPACWCSCSTCSSTPPMLFNRVHDAQVAAEPAGGRVRRRCSSSSTRRSPRADAPADAPTIAAAFLASDAAAAGRSARRPSRIVKEATGDERYNDVNYVFPTFITTQHADRPGRADDRGDLRRGDVGQRRRAERAVDRDGHRLLPAPFREGRDRRALPDGVEAGDDCWGLFACVVAIYAANQGSLIEVVNRFGSFFYGSILGVFILAILTKRATARGAFWGLIAGMVVVLIVAFTDA